MIPFNPTYRSFGENALLIDWPQKVDLEISGDVLAFQDVVEKENIKGVLDVAPTYASLLVRFDQAMISIDTLIKQLQLLYSKRKPGGHPTQIWHVPVCYDATFGFDLPALAQEKKCTEEAIINWHTETNYYVYFIGFLPGFLYLGGLDERLFQARKSVPHLRIPSGSVGIGGEQTGVYPVDSPGGWNIIGRTPLRFFNKGQEPPCFVRPHDQIRFFAVDKQEYTEISQAVDRHAYKIKCS